MIDVLRNLRADQMLVAPSAFKAGVPSESPAVENRPALTPREREVLECLGRGLPAKSVARVLGISVQTCRGYVKSLHAKLGVRSQVETVLRAQQLGLLGVPDGR